MLFEVPLGGVRHDGAEGDVKSKRCRLGGELLTVRTGLQDGNCPAGSAESIRNWCEKGRSRLDDWALGQASPLVGLAAVSTSVVCKVLAVVPRRDSWNVLVAACCTQVFKLSGRI
jgi:hypothetical protein